MTVTWKRLAELVRESRRATYDGVGAYDITLVPGHRATILPRAEG